MYQHEETGRTSFIASWERKDGWKPSSTRMKLIGPLYLAPPQRKPLTDDMVHRAMIALNTASCKELEPTFDEMKSALEAAHGTRGEV
jgi:hypothetical protein